MTTVAERDGAMVSEARMIRAPLGQKRALLLAGLLVGAWIFAVLATLSGLAILIPVVVVLGVGSLLRVGHTVLDRLVISVALCAGLLIAAGLLFSVWPWGLNPIAVGGVCLSAVIVVGGLVDRRPQLPLRVAGSDLVILVAPLVSWWIVRKPVSGATFRDMLPFVSARQDFFNHYSLFDAIHRIGGYAFLHADAAGQYVTYPNQYAYPSGAHYLYAMLDTFRLSSADPGSSLGEFLRYYQYEAMGTALLGVSVTWAARWVAGPMMSGWRRAFICGVVASVTVFGQVSAPLFWQGYDGEVLALSFLTVLTALVVRPPARVREQILIAASLVVAIAYTYSLFSIYTGIIVLCAAVAYRHRILRYWRFTLGVVVVAAPVAAIPYVLAQEHSFGDPGSIFTQGGTTLRLSRALSVAFALIAVAALASRAGRRLPQWRILAAAVALTSLVAVYAGYIGYEHNGHTRYYYEKMVEGAWVIALAGFGAIGFFLKRTVVPAGRRRWLAELPASVVAVVLAVVLANGLPLARIEWREGPRPNQDASWGALWAKGFVTAPYAGALGKYGEHFRYGDGVQTGLIYSDNSDDNYHATMFLSVIDHDWGAAGGLGISGANGLASLKAPPKGKKLNPSDADSVAKLERWIGAHKPGFRIVVGNVYLEQLLDRYRDANPDLHLAVVRISGL